MIVSVAKALIQERVQRRALLELHRTAEGEAALLEQYARPESAGRTGVAWVDAILAARDAEVRGHAEALRTRIGELTGRTAGATKREGIAETRMRAFVARWREELEKGDAAAALAWLLERDRAVLAAMRRHRDALETAFAKRGAALTTSDLLTQLVSETARCVRSLEAALDRAVAPGEKLVARRLIAEAAGAGSDGVRGAAGLLSLGVALRVVDGVQGLVRIAVRAIGGDSHGT